MIVNNDDAAITKAPHTIMQHQVVSDHVIMRWKLSISQTTVALDHLSFVRGSVYWSMMTQRSTQQFSKLSQRDRHNSHLHSIFFPVNVKCCNSRWYRQSQMIPIIKYWNDSYRLLNTFNISQQTLNGYTVSNAMCGINYSIFIIYFYCVVIVAGVRVIVIVNINVIGRRIYSFESL